MTSIFHRSLDKDYPEAVAGQGVFLVNGNGDKVLDGSSGAAVSCLGHNHPEVIESIVAQLRGLSFAHTSFFTSSPAEQLAALITAQSGDAFSRVTFVCSGSEAVEGALKMARQYHIYNGQPDRANIIGRCHSYHGNTLGALATGYNPQRRLAMQPILSPAFHHVSRCFYGADADGRTEEQYEDDLIAEYRSKIGELGAHTVAAIVVEPVVGATLGAVAPTRGYLPRLRSLCDEHGILLIFDEVMCGMGRVGSYHAWQSLGGVAPDMQTVGKGLGGGYVPLSATLIGPKVVDMFERCSKGADKFMSAHTFQGHALGCAGALAVQTILQRDNLLANVREMGDVLAASLEAGLPAELVSHGAHVRGLGLFRAVDFGAAKDVLGGALAGEVADECFKQGAAVYPCSSVVDAVLLAPPYIISADEVAQLVGIFLRSLTTVLSRRNSA
ncbi:hypothetical protein ACO1O0_005604 [Amphichorda felina]